MANLAKILLASLLTAGGSEIANKWERMGDQLGGEPVSALIDYGEDGVRYHADRLERHGLGQFVDDASVSQEEHNDAVAKMHLLYGEVKEIEAAIERVESHSGYQDITSEQQVSLNFLQAHMIRLSAQMELKFGFQAPQVEQSQAESFEQAVAELKSALERSHLEEAASASVEAMPFPEQRRAEQLLHHAIEQCKQSIKEYSRESRNSFKVQQL